MKPDSSPKYQLDFLVAMIVYAVISAILGGCCGSWPAPELVDYYQSQDQEYPYMQAAAGYSILCFTPLAVLTGLFYLTKIKTGSQLLKGFLILLLTAPLAGVLGMVVGKIFFWWIESQRVPFH